MADYNVDFTPAKGEGTSPLAPVQEHTINAPNPWVGFAAGAASVLMQTMKDKRELEKQQLIDTTIASFTREQTSINDAVAQGSMSKAQGDARAKANFSKYAASYPSLIAKLKESNVALVENTALSDMKAETQMFQEEDKKLRQGMIDAGFPLYPGMDKKTEESFKTAYQVSQKVKGEFEFMAKKNAEARAQGTYERDNLEWTNKQKAGQLLSELGDAHVGSAIDFIKTLPTITDKNQALILSTQFFSKIEGTIAALAGTHPELAGNWNKMFGDLKNTAKEVIEGKLDATASENLLKRVKTQSQLMALASPEMRSLYALNTLAPNAVANTTNLNIAALNTFTRMTSEGGAKQLFLGDKDLEKDLYNYFGNNVNFLATNPPDAVAIKDGLKKGTLNILDQVSKAGANGLSSADLSRVADFLASPQFGTMVDQKIVTKEQAAAAKSAFQYVYENQVSKAVEGTLQQPFSTGLLSNANGRTYGDLIDFKWVGDGVKIDKKGGYPMNLQEMGERERFIQELQPVNKAINILIKAGAHMDGTRDYASYWEENKHRILPQVFSELDGPGATHREPGSEKDKFIPASDLKAGMELGGFIYQGGSPDNPKSWKKK